MDARGIEELGPQLSNIQEHRDADGNANEKVGLEAGRPAGREGPPAGVAPLVGQMPEILNLYLGKRLLQTNEVEKTLGQDADHGSMNEIKGKRMFTKV